MLYLTDDIEVDFQEADRKTNFVNNKINNRIFTVKNTHATYRQINLLSEAGLLNDTRIGEKGWRKFSLRELTYITIVMEAKAFGLQHNQLRELYRLFIDPKYSYIANLVIGCVFGHIEVTIEIYPDGKVDIYDPAFYVMLSTNHTCIKLCLNNAVNDVLKQVGLDTFPIKWTVDGAYARMSFIPKEGDLIKIIRDKGYSSVTVKKKDGEISVIHAERTKPENNELTDKDVLRILKEKDFQDINIIKRDGKIVSHTINETIKL